MRLYFFHCPSFVNMDLDGCEKNGNNTVCWTDTVVCRVGYGYELELVIYSNADFRC